MLSFAFLTLILFLILLLLTTKKLVYGARYQKLPPSPPKLPLIGNLHQVGSLSQTSLHALSLEHGPLMLLHLGQIKTLIVSSPEMAQEIMKKHDDIFASRPSTKASNMLLYGGKNVGFAPYGEYWKHAKKLYMVHMLGTTKTGLKSAVIAQISVYTPSQVYHAFKSIHTFSVILSIILGVSKVKSYELARQEEVRLAVEKIRHAQSLSNPVDLSEVFSSFTLDILCRVVSKNFSKKHLLRDLIEEGTALFGEFNFHDYMPPLYFLDILLKFHSKAKMVSKKWDDLLEQVITEHLNRVEKDGDFIDVLLSLQANDQADIELTKDHIKAILVVVNYNFIS